MFFFTSNAGFPTDFPTRYAFCVNPIVNRTWAKHVGLGFATHAFSTDMVI